MKVLMANGSPHREGCTYTALSEVAAELEREGIETEIFWLGVRPLAGCIACGSCGETGKCAFDDAVNLFAAKAAGADGFIFGTPVHYAGASGALTSFMDRLFISASPELFRLKPAAVVCSARRAGTTATYDQINKYFGINEMPIISSSYWNMVHGNTPDEVRQDEEGLQIMRVLARNMAYYLKCRQAADEKGVPLPKQEEAIKTNFVRQQ